MIFFDPSELKSSSNSLKDLGDLEYYSVAGLEDSTGADCMISPDGLPTPITDKFLQLHIDSGAKLVQIKYGHDLPTSKTDGRLNDQQYRMLSIGANPWQCELLFIGLFSFDATDEMAIINGQLTYGQPMKWDSLDHAINYWIERGGSFYFIPSGKLLPRHLINTQTRINAYVNDKDVKTMWPVIPAFYEEIEPKNPYMKNWKVGQRLEIIEDIRTVFCAIPGARIGPVKATAILDYMKENGIRQDLTGFYKMMSGDAEMLKVPGIGPKLYQAMYWGLWRTLEERNERKDTNAIK